MFDIYLKNVIFSFWSLLLLIFLIIIFFTKRKEGQNSKGLIFMIISNSFLIVCEFVIPYLCMYHSQSYLLIKLVSYIYDIFVCFYTSCLLVLLFDNASFNDENFRLKYSKYRKLLFIIPLIIIIGLSFILEINCSFDNISNTYSFSGTYKDAVYIFCTVMSVLCITFTIIGKDKMNKNVLFVLYISFGYYALDIFISSFFGISYHDISLLYTIIIYAFYLTLESQDTMLLNEYKNISYEAEKDIKDKNDFLFKMSRQIRTPLTTIIGFSELLDEDSLEYIKYIKDSSNNLFLAVNSLVDTSSIKTNNILLNEFNYYIKDLFDELSCNIDVLFDKRITLNIMYNNVCNYLYGDREKLLRSIEYIICSIASSENEIININVSNVIQNNISNLSISINGNSFNTYNEEYVDISSKLLSIMNGKIEISNNTFIISLSQLIRDNSLVELSKNEYSFENMNVLIIGNECSTMRVFKNILNKNSINYEIINVINNYENNLNLNKYDSIFVFNDSLDVSFMDVVSFLKRFGMSLPSVILLSSYLNVISSNMELYNDYIKLPIINEINVYRVLNKLKKKEVNE